MYTFTNTAADKLFKEMSAVVPIEFLQNDSMTVNAMMDFDHASQKVVVTYKKSAHEMVNMLHEIIHVEMFFKHGYRQLAWASPPPSDDTKKVVKCIRDIVDDTYVFGRLSAGFGVFPISTNFFAECRKAVKKLYMPLVPAPERDWETMLTAAWNLRMADLCLTKFAVGMDSSQTSICTDFLSYFGKKFPKVNALLGVVRTLVTPDTVIDPVKHAQALEALRNHCGIGTSVIHLAQYQKSPTGDWILKKL